MSFSLLAGTLNILITGLFFALIIHFLEIPIPLDFLGAAIGAAIGSYGIDTYFKASENFSENSKTVKRVLAISVTLLGGIFGYNFVAVMMF